MNERYLIVNDFWQVWSFKRNHFEAVLEPDTSHLRDVEDEAQEQRYSLNSKWEICKVITATQWQGSRLLRGFLWME